MNYIIKVGRNIIAISDRIEAERHRHWLLQMFLSSHNELNIEVKDQRIQTNAVIVNTNTLHQFAPNGEPNFTMLIDPTSVFGRRIIGIIKNQSFYVLPNQQVDSMQIAFNNAIAKNSREGYIGFARWIINSFSSDTIKSFDDRVMEVLTLLDECAHEDDSHQIKYFSNKVALSESRLAHLFKEETGVPLKSYIVLHKLQKAYDSIFDGENITTAALHAGFDSPSHFAYINKQMTGMSATNILKDSEFLKVSIDDTW